MTQYDYEAMMSGEDGVEGSLPMDCVDCEEKQINAYKYFYEEKEEDDGF